MYEEVMTLQVIYIDVLLCINLIVNFLLLSASAFYLHEKVSVKRLILGAAVGAAGSLSILLPKLPFVSGALLKAAVGFGTVISAFGRRSVGSLMKLFAVFLTATFFFGGAMAALWYFFTPNRLMVRNSVVYLNISPAVLIVFSMICYGAFRLFYTVTGRYKAANTVCILTVKYGSNYMRIPAKIDTGNTLREPFSQCPVIVAGRETARSIIPVELAEYETVTTLGYRTEISGVRFVPFTAVGTRGILPSFKADEVYINDKPCQKNVYIALCREEELTGELKALVPYELLE